MSRTAASTLWLTLESSEGETSRLGVTAEHPLFAEGLGWTEAGDLMPGDQIRGQDLGLITILGVTLDDSPQRVYNMEVADAHTYFAGELDVWAHNARRRTSGGHTQNRHVANVGGKSTFCRPSGLPRLIGRAMRNPDNQYTDPRTGYTIYEKLFGRVIGRSRCGDPVSNIRVVVRPNGREVTAFPF